MYKDALQIMACPQCKKKSLDLQIVEKDMQDQVKQGRFKCQNCEVNYPVLSDIPIMFREKEIMDSFHQSKIHKIFLKKIEELENEFMFEERSEAIHKLNDHKLGAFFWEKHLYENWVKHEVKLEPDEIIKYLREDHEGKRRKLFFEYVKKNETSLQGKTILNVGCGRDFLLELFQKEGACVVEQDIVFDALAGLKSRGAPICICCDLRSLPLLNEFADIVISFGVLHHVHPIREPLSEMIRVLKKGGSIYLDEPNINALPSLVKRMIPLRKIKRFLKEKALQGKRHSMPSPFEQSLKLGEVIELLKSLNIEKISYSYSGMTDPSLPAPVYEIFNFLLRDKLYLNRFSSHFSIYARK